MTLKLNINIDTEKDAIIFLNARKTIDGNIIISDHPDMDLLISLKNNKIIALAKKEMDDEVYDSQKRLYKHLVKMGIVNFDSVQSGNLFMSMEACHRN